MLNEVLTSRVISETNLVTLVKKGNIKPSEVVRVHAKEGGLVFNGPWMMRGWVSEGEQMSDFATGHRFQDSKIQYIRKKENWGEHSCKNCE